MKKLLFTMLTIAVTSFFLTACGSDDGGSNNPGPQYPQCERYTGYEYERCMEQYYPTNVTGLYKWDTGVVSVNSSEQDRLAVFLESRGNNCNAFFPNSSWLGGCKRVGERLRVTISANNLSANQSVIVSVMPHSEKSSTAVFSISGHLRPSGNKLRVDASPFMIVIDQDRLYEGSMSASIYLDGALLASTSLSPFNPYYDDGYNCNTHGGGTSCQWYF